MRFSPKLRFALVNLAVAALLIAGYGWKQVSTGSTDLTRARLSDFEEGAGLYLLKQKGKPVGRTRLQVKTTQDSAVIVEETELHVPTPQGRRQTATEYSRQVLDGQLRLQRFEFRLQAGQGQQQQTVHLKAHRPGRTAEQLIVNVETGGQSRQTTVQAPLDVVLGSGMWPRLALAGALKVGNKLTLQEFNPTSLTLREIVLEVKDKTLVASDFTKDKAEVDSTDWVPAYSIQQSIGGVTYDVLVSGRGLPVRAELPLGLTVEPATVEEVLAASQQWKKTGGLDAGSLTEGTLISRSAIGSGVQISNLEARQAQTMRVVVTKGSLPDDARGGNQTLRGDTLLVKQRGWPEQAGYQLSSAVPAQTQGSWPDSLQPYLQSGPFIEGDHEEIQVATRQAIAEATRPAEAIRQINQYVFHRLEKTYTASIPSAIEALRGGSGDCNEHAVLTTAMLRAAGIPARVVSGVAYLQGNFFFHAWSEVWIGGQWVPIDPTFGVAPADAGRVRMYTGIEHLHDVIELLGTLNLHIKEIS